jgi:hypothetical protein
MLTLAEGRMNTKKNLRKKSSQNYQRLSLFYVGKHWTAWADIMVHQIVITPL